jgi:hypothetical protein
MSGQDSLTEILRILGELQTKVGAIVESFGHDPISDSIAVKEQSSSANSEQLKNAYSQGSLLIEVCADHLVAFVRAVTEPVLTVSSWASIRGVLEASAISSWLLDPKLESKGRVARSYAFRCEGLLQQVKFARTTNPSDAAKPQQRLDYVLDQAKKFGMQTKNDQNGKAIGLINAMPSITELIRDQLDDESMFRLLSAIVHGHPWALQQLSFKRADSPQRIFLEKNLNIEMVLLLAITGVKSLRKPIEYKCQLFDWSFNDLKYLFENSIARLKEIFPDASSIKLE